MRSTLTTAAVVALLAAGAGTASATDVASSRTDAYAHAQAMKAQDVHVRHQQRDLTVGATPVHVVRTAATGGGFDWTDAGIGAGLAAALLLTGAGVSTVRRQPRLSVR
jgi:hypothetical protein